MHPVMLYVQSLIFGLLGATIFSRFGGSWGFTDLPDARSSHTIPTPKGGGVGIAAGFFFASIMLGIPTAFWVSGVLLASLGLVGDYRHLSPRVRLAIQCVGVLYFLSFISGEGGAVFHSVILLPVFCVFIVGTTNFYNFMDGINGIAAIVGMVAFYLMGVFAFSHGGSSLYGNLSLCISLSCAGFLPLNFPRARVFMGDVGSILLGFAFSAIAVLLSKHVLDFITVCSFLFLFFADGLTTMSVRLKDSESLTKPHRRHIYQLLANEGGLPHWKVSLGYGLIQLLIGGTILAAHKFGSSLVIPMLVIYSGVFLLISHRIRLRLDPSLTV